MDTESVSLDGLAILRSAFENGTPLGWEAVHAFAELQGIALPEPYRTCVAEIERTQRLVEAAAGNIHSAAGISHGSARHPQGLLDCAHHDH